MNKKILLIGGGGHCTSVIDSLLEQKAYEKIGIVEKQGSLGSKVLGVPVVGSDDDLFALFLEGYKYAFVTVGSVGDPSLRIKLHNILLEIGFEIPIVTDPSAIVSKHANIEEGVYIGKGSIVNAGSRVRQGAILNSGSIVEHDCDIGAFAHIAPGAVLGGAVVIGENTHVGSNATVKQGLCIGPHSIIGMGSVVLGDIGDRILAYGNPCREVKKL